MTSPYIGNTKAQKQAMLGTMGLTSVAELLRDIPEKLRNPLLALPPPLSEAELKRELGAMARSNFSLEDTICFLGAGSYHHFIPGVVQHIISRGEFATAYTPYQGEASQGTLQTIYEFQSLLCQLTGMDVANAGMYDGASALAEAALMACRVTSRHRVGVLETVSPRYQEVIRTYVEPQGIDTVIIPPKSPLADASTACLVAQQPNFFGYMENLEACATVAQEKGALLVVSVDPISLGLFRPPSDYGADIMVGEGQALGTPPSFGGPYLGLFACKEAYLRQMPGRLVGLTVDAAGQEGFVLTLQTREQHIRRERSTSNICTNEALVALAATVYLAALGNKGLRRVAELCYHKAHYAASRIAQIPGYTLPFKDVFFKEFVIRCPLPPQEINQRLLDIHIIGGLDISQMVDQGMLLCVTEMNTKDEIDALVAELERLGSL
ncbi:MAG: aminomethyl-transferring glycine dehydrogenase subunit GcvPA [Chloroflexi bacterium]|nr:aminomethyl-transferring glycine dehydrogenase subunit GcvPA [Chloroflexota bacterium]